jgi:hypothetical protein
MWLVQASLATGAELLQLIVNRALPACLAQQISSRSLAAPFHPRPSAIRAIGTPVPFLSQRIANNNFLVTTPLH